MDDIIERNDPRYKKMVFRFWQLLTTEQRPAVMVELNIYPPQFEQTPKYLHYGLELALKHNLLSKLWDAINRLVPNEEWERNPFSTAKKEARYKSIILAKRDCHNHTFHLAMYRRPRDN